MVNINNLCVGMVVKNYKEMCKELGEEVKGGDSKKAQIKEWERFIGFEKEGQKYIITEIYDEPLEKVDGRAGNGSELYGQYVEDVLMAYFESLLDKEKVDNLEHIITSKDLIKLLGMVNSNYYREDSKAVLNMVYGCSKFNINNFYDRTQRKFKEVINNSLISLDNRRVIDYKKTAMIVRSSGGLYSKKLATEEELHMIKVAEAYALKELDLDSIIQVSLLKKSEEFYDLVNEYSQENYGWDYSFKVYLFKIDRKMINFKKEYMKNKNKSRLKLNENLREFFKEQAERSVDKVNGVEGGFKFPVNYLDKQNQLAEILLNPKAKRLY